LNFT
jgi:serine/threonine protein kinase